MRGPILVCVAGSAIAVGAGIAVGWTWVYLPAHLVIPFIAAIVPGLAIALISESTQTRSRPILILATALATVCMVIAAHLEMYHASTVRVNDFVDFLQHRLDKGEIVIPSKRDGLRASGFPLFTVWMLDIAAMAASIWLLARRELKVSKIIK